MSETDHSEKLSDLLLIALISHLGQKKTHWYYLWSLIQQSFIKSILWAKKFLTFLENINGHCLCFQALW